MHDKTSFTVCDAAPEIETTTDAGKQREKKKKKESFYLQYLFLEGGLFMIPHPHFSSRSMQRLETILFKGFPIIISIFLCEMILIFSAVPKISEETNKQTKMIYSPCKIIFHFCLFFVMLKMFL